LPAILGVDTGLRLCESEDYTMNNGQCELCDAEIYPHGYHVYIKGQWRLYRVCEACHVVYQHLWEDE